MLLNHLVVANTVDYEAARKYILKKYTCGTIEDCNNKKPFNEKKLHNKFQEKKYLLELKKNIAIGDKTAIEALDKVTKENELIIKTLEKELQETDENKHFTRQNDLQRIMPISVGFVGAISGLAMVIAMDAPAGSFGGALLQLIVAPTIFAWMGTNIGNALSMPFINPNDLHKFNTAQQSLVEMNKINNSLTELLQKQNKPE